MSQLKLRHPDLDTENLKFNTVEVHAGEPRDMYGALIPPIYQTSTFYFDTTDDAVKACEDFTESFAYSRITNPSEDYLAQKLAAVEHGKGCVVYASGMGAVTGALFALLKAGDHAIFTKAKYSGTEEVATDYFPRFGMEYDFFDSDDISQIEPLIKPNTKLIYLESPANPTMILVDIEAVVNIAKKHGIKVFVDNTFATPFNTNPLDLGVDVVIHSLTKYIGGHGDILGGAVISNDEEFIRECRLGTLMHLGSVIAPFTAFLATRGLKTLGVRMKQYNESALKIAEWLDANPKIDIVRYPLLKSNPQYEIAKRQMKGGGGMISFDVAGGLEAGKKFINSLKLCTIAVSLGDTETLVEQAAAMTHTMIPKETREAAGITDGMIRMSVGLEDPDDIIADLEQALANI
ncbi:MAG: aminotransferase class I/II-fold pyridoxal phosphate-dependent enzyme [Clostridiales bacterium]|nr:aminotransferase class I/II-fold pyridoxal phosphate-dependent enzyme [Clostridiales bacterium]